MTTEIIPFEGEFTQGEIQAFNEKYLAVMKGFANLKVEIKRLQDEEKKVKEQLEQVMDEYSIKSIDNRYVRITRIAPNAGKTVIDLDALKKEEPELYEELLADYPKTSGKKAPSIRFDAKG